MFYAAFRRARAAVTIYLGILAVLAILATVIVFIGNGYQFKVIPAHMTTAQTANGVTTMKVDTDDGKAIVVRSQTKDRSRSARVHGTIAGDQDFLAVIAAGMAYALAFLATALGLTFAAENDGHLEFAWPRPVTRERYALGIAAVDLAGMLVGFVLSIAIVVLGLLACGGIEILAASHFSAQQLGGSLLVLGFPVLMYAWIAALSASLRRGRAFTILIWPAMSILGLAASQSPAGSPFKPILVWLNTYVNPLSIFAQSEHHFLTVPWTIYGLAFAAVLFAATIAQWKRLEA